MADGLLEYNTAAEFLTRHGFDLDEVFLSDNHSRDDGRADMYSDGVLLALVCNEMSDYYGDNCLMVDRLDTLNKWSDASMVVRFPADEKVVERAIRFLRTQEGYAYSRFRRYLPPEPDPPCPLESRFEEEHE